MNDGDALLAAVLHAPADDAPRLILADWLDEHGDPDRASFIRVQIELARLDGRCRRGNGVSEWCDPDGTGGGDKHYPDCPAAALRARELKLLTAHGFDWFKLPRLATFSSRVGGPFEGWLLKRSGEPGIEIPVVVRRGFVAEARLTCAAFLGGPCEAIGPHHGDRCGSVRTGRIQSPNAQFTQDCPDCAGIGTTPGLAPALARHPVEVVRLVDREPLFIRGADEGYWHNEGDPVNGHVHRQSDLPTGLWESLEGYDLISQCAKIYATVDAANAALSAAAVAHLAALRGDA